MKITVRCIYFRPIPPNLLILNLDGTLWQKFLWGDKETRIDIVSPYLPKDHPPIREISWISLNGLKEIDKYAIIYSLTSSK